MVRFFVSMVVWAAIAHWAYNEVKVLAPGATPYIDSAFSYIQIPTHDQWDTSKIARVITELLPESLPSLGASGQSGFTAQSGDQTRNGRLVPATAPVGNLLRGSQHGYEIF